MKIFLACLLGFFFVGCSLKEKVITSKAYHIVLKNKNLKISDTGFINKSFSKKELQIFKGTTVVLSLHVRGKEVCLDLTCIDKKRFHEEFFGYSHYESFIDELLEFEPLYGKKNLTKLENGFEQNIKSENFDISYKIENTTLFFRDTFNGILLKIQEL